MKLFNNHTHTKNSHDSQAEIPDICANAINAGLSGFAITDHCDCEYADDPAVKNNILNSFNDAQNAKEKYGDTLVISSGVEVGEALFNPSFAAEIINSAEWDVILGSVHAVRYKDWEMPFSLIDFSDKTDSFINEYLKAYFDDVLETVCTADFDVLCHLTVPLRYIIKKYNRNADITPFYPVIDEILKETIHRDAVLEINTSNYTFTDNFFMPDEIITDKYIALGGDRFTIGSDAHIATDISKGLNEAAAMLKNKNIHKLIFFRNRIPVYYDI